jgi:sec-independent protein translocase protein TatB
LLLDLNFTKLLVLGLAALIIFGPERLPAMAAQAGRALRELRRIADGAKSELQDSLGPEFSDFDLADINPRQFVRKHLTEEFTGEGGVLSSWAGGQRSGPEGSATGPTVPLAGLQPGERPPFDPDAT